MLKPEKFCAYFNLLIFLVLDWIISLYLFGYYEHSFDYCLNLLAKLFYTNNSSSSSLDLIIWTFFRVIFATTSIWVTIKHMNLWFLSAFVLSLCHFCIKFMYAVNMDVLWMPTMWNLMEMVILWMFLNVISNVLDEDIEQRLWEDDQASIEYYSSIYEVI